MSARLDHAKSFRVTLPTGTTRHVIAGVETFVLPDPAANDALAIGDGTGSPVLSIEKTELGTSALRYKSNAKKRWDVGLDASENLTISRFNASEVLQDAITFNASSGMATLPAGLTVTAGGAVITAGGLTVTAGGAVITAGGLTVTAGDVAIGAGAASPTLAMDKAAAGTTSLDLKAASVLRGRLQLDASENVILSAHDASAVLTGSLTIDNATGTVTASNILGATTINTNALNAFALATADGGLTVNATGVKRLTVQTDASYADDAAAGAAGLTAGMVYKTATGELRIKV